MPSKMVGPMANSKSNGERDSDRRPVDRSNEPRQDRVATPARICDRPMVTTVRIRRGALKNRRMNTNSTSAPRAMAATRPTGAASRKGTPGPRMQQHAERGRHAAEVALGEVDDAVRPVDERDAEGDQRRDAADDHALEQHADRRGPEPLLDDVEDDDVGQ